MAELIDQIDNIEFKIKQLARKVELIKEENAALVKENTELRELLNENEEKEIKSIGQTAIEFEGKSKDQDGFKDQVRSELDGYISEIDHCIELLENL